MEEQEECFDAGEEFYDLEDTVGSPGVEEPVSEEPLGNRFDISVPRRQSLSIVLGRTRAEDGGGSVNQENVTREFQISVPRKQSLRLVFKNARSSSLSPTSVSSSGHDEKVEVKPDDKEQGTTDVSLPLGVELPHCQPAGRGVKRKLTSELPVKLEQSEGDGNGPEVASETPESVTQDVASTEERKVTEESVQGKQVQVRHVESEQAETATGSPEKYPINDEQAVVTTTEESGEDVSNKVGEHDKESSDSGMSSKLSEEETASNKDHAADDDEDVEELTLTKLFLKIAAKDGKEMLDFGKRPAKKAIKFEEEEEDSSAELNTEKETTDGSLRFADLEEDPPKKKTLRFADIIETGKTPPTKPKKALRFAEPDKVSKNVTFAVDRRPKKSVRFSDDDTPGQARKYSLDAPVTPKSVRFLLPSVDGTGKTTMRVYFPAVKRKRRETIKTATVKVYPDPPLSLVLYMMDTKRFSHMTGHRRAKACHILSWIIGVVTALGLAVCMVMMLIYFYLHPQLPEINMVNVKLSDIYMFKLDELDLERQREENLGQYYNYILILEAGLLVRYHNVNKRLDIYNDYLKVTLYYSGTIWVTSYINDNFLVTRGNVTVLNHKVFVARWLTLNVGYTLEKEFAVKRISIVSEFLLKGRMSGAGRLVTSRQFSLRIRCALQIYASNELILLFLDVSGNYIENEDCILVES